MRFFSAVTAGALFAAVASAAEPALSDNFNSLKLESTMVAIEDHPEKEPWYFNGPRGLISCSEGVLTLGAAPGGREVRMISKLKFKNGTLKTRIRLDKTGEGIHFYIGFQENRPWNNRSAWVLFNNSGNGHLYMKNELNKMPRNMIEKIRTGKLEAGKWYDLTIKLDSSGSELFIDGISRGKLALPECVPAGGLNVMFIVNPGGKGSSLSIDSVTVEGEVDNTAKKSAPVKKKVAIPVPPSTVYAAGKVVPDAPAAIRRQERKICLENGFYRYKFDISAGLQLEEVLNRFTGRNMLRRNERIFIVYCGNQALENRSFKVEKVDISGNDLEKKAVFYLKNPAAALSGKVTLTVKSASPELLMQCEFTNTGKKRNKFGVSFPVFGHLQAGKVLTDDEFFYPMESGMAGKLDCVLRHAYGVTNFMQLMSVWNPVSGGGFYAYTTAADGYPQVMELKRITDPANELHSYSAIVWRDLDKSNFGKDKGTSLAWRHLDYELEAGKSTDLPAAVAAVSRGGFDEGLKSYTRFVRTWFKKPYATPKWYMEMYACLSAHPHSGLWCFSPSPSKGFYNRAANEYSYGKSITHLEKNALQEIAFWWDAPEKFDIPTEELRKYQLPSINFWQIGDYDYPSRRGGLQALKDEISLIRQKESRVIYYTFPQGVAKGTRAYEDCRKFAAKNVYGRYKTNYTGDNMGWFLCNMEMGFADYFSKKFARNVAETGSDGIRLDVLSRVEACYNPEHAHSDGTMRGTADSVMLGEVLRKFKAEMYQVSPEKIVTVEHSGSDYLCQFHDGYFSENINWISESPQWAHFRNLNAYMTVFTRFYFPEVKTWIHGASNRKEAIRMSLFNACGFACTSIEGIRSLRTLEENSDVLDNELEKTPNIRTAAAQIFANEFPGKADGKYIWTVLNRSGKTADKLLEVPDHPGNFRYIEVFNDLEVSAEKKAGLVLLSAPVANNEAAVIVRLVKQLEVTQNDDVLLVKVPDPAGKHCRIIFNDDNFMSPPENIFFENGLIRKKIPVGTKKIIIKLYNGKYLDDEVVIIR